jgi:hypothetical protein
MPKAPAKKTTKPVKRKTAAPKASAKPKMKAKPKAKPAPPEKSFMWKILKRKEEERMMHDKNGVKPPSANPEGHFKNNVRPMSFQKFAGPRRRVG